MEDALDLFSWVLPISVFIIFLFFLNEQYSNIWEKKKVPCLKRKFIFGNVFSVMTLKSSLAQLMENIYWKAGDKLFIGFYVMNKPALLIKDPAIIRQILVKDFNNFMNRNFNLDHKVDPTGPGNTFFNTSPRWKIIRTKISPIFTSSRIKYMFALMSEVAEDLYTKISKERNDKNIFNVSEISAQYTTDIISSVVLGFKSNCLTDPDSIYRKMGKKAFELSRQRGFQMATLFLTPSIANFLKIRSFPGEIVDLLEETFREMAKYREENNIQRNDMIDLLSKLQKEINEDNETNNESTLTYNELIGTIVSFFVAGFETTASTISFALYELALNQEYQDLTRSEIKQALSGNKGNLTYDLLQQLKYLDMCVSETLRKYPLLGFLDRKCMRDYKIPGTDVVIPAGTPVYISLNALQNDPKYFPDPKKFDPYRFSEERKQDIVPFTNMPFGEGPRICIGMRFGLISAKAGLLHILKNFKVLPCDETPNPIEFCAMSVLNTPKNFSIKLNFLPIVEY